MKASYYPGCALEGSARGYARSISEICSTLNLRLEEIPDWNCCGATAAHSVDHQASIELAGRTLNLATGLSNKDILVPCPMCFNRLKTAALALRQDGVNQYNTPIREPLPEIWDLAKYFATGKMLTRVSKHLKQPLAGLKVVSYYGCMANRPPEITGATDCEDPQDLDDIVRNLGATAVPWPYKTDCCGAGQVLSRPDIVSRLVGKLYDMANRVGADAIVVSCQMCQANLDMYQGRISADWGRRFSFPIYYFSELIGLACDVKCLSEWLSDHITDPFSLLRKLNLLNE